MEHYSCHVLVALPRVGEMDYLTGDRKGHQNDECGFVMSGRAIVSVSAQHHDEYIVVCIIVYMYHAARVSEKKSYSYDH